MRTVSTSKRGCGYKKAGGFYLVSEPSEDGVLPLWITIDPPIECEDKPTRGPVLIDGDALLSKLPEDQWFVGASADHKQKMKADEWSLERFGMTTTMRLRNGECAGLKGVDEALEYLLLKVQWNGGVIKDTMSNLTNADIASIPRIAQDYAKLVSHIQNFTKEYEAKELVNVAADTWRIASKLPPRKRPEIIPFLLRILIAINLTKDALYMKRRFLDG